MDFETLGLSEPILRAITECGYSTPTAIQEKAIPSVLMTRDVVGLAQTGTGKTASFILPMIDILAGGRAKARMPRSLVLEPTRELAAQVAESFDKYGKYSNLSKALLVGGESMAEQKKILDRGVDVLIATPGRLLDLFGQGAILLNDIKVLVIDEADRMLDMGFIPDIEKIVSYVPPIRQTLLFSATMPGEIKRIADQFLSNPKRVETAPASSPAETVKQTMIVVTPRTKKKSLQNVLETENVKNAFIFCNRKRDVGTLAKWLKEKGDNADALHGDMPQTERTKTLKAFKDGEIKLLVCSDVAARGLDIADVSHVFNYDVPMNAEDYIHRIGRTGRAGKEGRAFTFASKEDDKFVAAIEKLIGRKMEIEDTIGKISEKSKDNKEAAQKQERKPSQSREPQNREQSHKQNNKAERPEGKSSRHADTHDSNRQKQGDAKGHNRRYRDDVASDPGFGDHIPAFFKAK